MHHHMLQAFATSDSTLVERGVAAMDVCRPVPFGVKTRPSVRGIVQSALTGVFKSDR